MKAETPHRLVAALRILRGIVEGSGGIVLRPSGWNALSDEAFEVVNSWRRAKHVYRGMTSKEYDATVGKRQPIQSTGEHSFQGEGTNFSDDPGDAESYVNFGKDDPRKTGKPTYVVEVELLPSMKRWRDGYIKTSDPVSYEFVTRVWKMADRDGAIVAEKVRG
jgi:hypothetical protein